MTSDAPNSPTVGQKLREARKQSGKSVAQIAQATRIFESRLEAIERDDYSAAGTAPAFVIGYVKTYAKQVGVAEKPLVKELEAYYLARKVAEERDAPVVVSKTKLNWMPWAATILALAIFVGLGQWFFAQQQDQRIEDGATSSEVASASQAIIDSSVADVNNREKTTPLTQRDSNLMPRSMPDVEPLEEPESEVMSESQELKTVSTGSGRVATGAVLPQAAGGNDESMATANREQGLSRAQTEQSILNNAAANSFVGNNTAEGTDSLALQFTGDCWVEVYDAKGSRRVAKLVKDTGQVQLTGLAPFDVKLGDATVVSGTVNGRSIDLTPRSGRRVLRIQVGP